ncbi:hypothetical protein AB0K74_35335 [Streptomyces sp. NPDC056159]|uniref:hypothetical protein n=1 Tax=Streptomyces sp. NPDC056159 TaxID=3155537 RepID=UPI003433DCF8
MTTAELRLPPVDRDKSPLLDVVRVVDALRGSPHIRFVAGFGRGDEQVWFTDADGVGYALSLATVEPVPDEAQGEAFAWEAHDRTRAACPGPFLLYPPPCCTPCCTVVVCRSQ